MSSQSWALAGATEAQLWYERSALAGLFIGAAGFGVHATLFFQVFRHLCARIRHRREQLLLGYVSVVFILSNIANGANLKFGEMVFINNRDYPGGPGAYFVQQSTALTAVLCNTIYICLTWFQDGLLLYRFWIIYGRRWYIVAFPTLMFLATFVLSCILITMLNQPTLTLWSTISFQLALSYWSISIAFNVLVTILISVRLLIMRSRSKHIQGPDSSSPYITVSAMLVESAFIYSSTGLAFLISYAINSPVQNLFLPLLGQVQSIAPLLIILRVAEGTAWSRNTASELVSSNLRFVNNRRRLNAPVDGSATILNTISITGELKASRQGDEESVVSRPDNFLKA
ncbi:hypothetical protein BDZ94DRAFT_1163508 [Collybia nuda]|uniref:Uncharacterized protein n=1 Tax=Collybia nuda TaxID=64659 RepID=A0A9P6CF41_9AGAR|nr:hypothetical protein BDZ94DRAFT_1163508 [Collybia nuda]